MSQYFPLTFLPAWIRLRITENTLFTPSHFASLVPDLYPACIMYIKETNWWVKFLQPCLVFLENPQNCTITAPPGPPHHSQLNSNPSGNRQLLGQTNVGTVSDFFTVSLLSKGPVRDNLNKFVYSTIRTWNIWYIKPGPVQV